MQIELGERRSVLQVHGNHGNPAQRDPGHLTAPLVQVEVVPPPPELDSIRRNQIENEFRTLEQHVEYNSQLDPAKVHASLDAISESWDNVRAGFDRKYPRHAIGFENVVMRNIMAERNAPAAAVMRRLTTDDEHGIRSLTQLAARQVYRDPSDRAALEQLRWTVGRYGDSRSSLRDDEQVQVEELFTSFREIIAKKPELGDFVNREQLHLEARQRISSKRRLRSGRAVVANALAEKVSACIDAQTQDGLRKACEGTKFLAGAGLIATLAHLCARAEGRQTSMINAFATCVEAHVAKCPIVPVSLTEVRPLASCVKPEEVQCAAKLGGRGSTGIGFLYFTGAFTSGVTATGLGGMSVAHFYASYVSLQKAARLRKIQQMLQHEAARAPIYFEPRSEQIAYKRSNSD